MPTPSKECVSRIPSQKLVGRRIRLNKCNDSITELKPGATGTVSFIDDAGTLHVNWDSGSTLGLCWDDGDRWTVLSGE
jgi:hypothetical protein